MFTLQFVPGGGAEVGLRGRVHDMADACGLVDVHSQLGGAAKPTCYQFANCLLRHGQLGSDGLQVWSPAEPVVQSCLQVDHFPLPRQGVAAQGEGRCFARLFCLWGGSLGPQFLKATLANQVREPGDSV